MEFGCNGGYYNLNRNDDGETNGHGDICWKAFHFCAKFFIIVSGFLRSRLRIGLQKERMAGNDELEWPVIGIDLGTTNSCVAVWHKGRVEIIPNELGNRTTPSVVSFTDYDRLIGEAAMNQASSNLVNTIFDAKRLIGRRFCDDIVKQDTELWPFKVIQVDGIDSDKLPQPMIVVNYMGQEKRFTPEEISAMIIAKMKGIAEAFLGTVVKNAVITVPAHFNSSQRQATKDAGTIAGLSNIYLINEPTAAAITYSLDTYARKNVLVFHLGGGTCDVSLVEINKDGIEVKSTCGNSHLGGTDFDNRMVCEFVKEFKEKHGKDISKNPRALARLRVASEKAKRILSLLPEADVEIDCLFEDTDFRSTITCAQFEELNSDLFQKCELAIDQCLKSARKSKSDVHDVVLVGGSSRVRNIQNMLKGYSCSKELCKTIHHEEAVVSGAAIYAAILSGVFTRNENIALKDIKALSLDVHYSHDGNTESVCKLNTAIPKMVYHTKKINFGEHPTYMLEVFEKENSKSNIVSTCAISRLPKWTDTHKILVYFDIDVNGILNVSVGLTASRDGNQLAIVKWNGRLSEEDIEKMIKEAESYNAQDEARKKLLEAKSDLESNAYAILEQLDDTGNVNNEEVEKIREDIGNTLQLIDHISEFSDISEFQKRLRELQNRVKKLI